MRQAHWQFRALLEPTRSDSHTPWVVTLSTRPSFSSFCSLLLVIKLWKLPREYPRARWFDKFSWYLHYFLLSVQSNLKSNSKNKFYAKFNTWSVKSKFGSTCNQIKLYLERLLVLFLYFRFGIFIMCFETSKPKDNY